MWIGPAVRCEVCGPDRIKHFSPVDGDPLVDFLNWLLYDLDKKYTTYAFAHFGGKFDHQLCKGELQVILMR